ncbi:MAG: 6-phosphogluconolactonase [Ardenticatenaceae bacterium]|nr:6-phosphogluconolactonase [Ardenticatenaceae bacterium]
MQPKSHVTTFATLEELSQAAARQFVASAQTAIQANGRFLVALSGGSTPRHLYSLLSRTPYAHDIPWANTHILWGDERLVPPDDVGSSYKQAHDLLLQDVPIPPQQIHRVKGELGAATAVADYIQQLQELAEPGRSWPHLDLALMGLGRDGHTASLFPGPLNTEETVQPVITTTAHYEDRPAQRLSLTPLVFNDAQVVLFLVAGANKAQALTAVLHHHDTPEQWPAQRIQPHSGHLLWYIDQAAAGNHQ